LPISIIYEKSLFKVFVVSYYIVRKSEMQSTNVAKQTGQAAGMLERYCYKLHI